MAAAVSVMLHHQLICCLYHTTPASLRALTVKEPRAVHGRVYRYLAGLGTAGPYLEEAALVGVVQEADVPLTVG